MRVALGISQEEFDAVSSRTYVSAVERGIYAPTFAKIDLLVRELGVHPLTVLVLAYAKSPGTADIDEVLQWVKNDIQRLGLSVFASNSAGLPRGRSRQG